MAKTKSAYAQFREIGANYQEYLRLAQEVKDNKVVPDIHNIAAGILDKKGLTDEAKALKKSKTRPDNHALLGIIQEGTDIFGKEFNDFGKNQLVAIVNSKDLKTDRVRDTLLLLPPEKNVLGYELLSEAHRDAAEFYRDLYLYQQDGKLSDEQKAGVIHNMKVRVLGQYQEKFKDDQTFFNRLGVFIQGYEDIAIAQYKGFTTTRIKEFSDKLKKSNAGEYVEAMKLSDEKKSMFYQALLE